MKYLYNIGCSFSEGNGIAEDLGIDPVSEEGRELEAKSRYSAVLAKKLNLIEINEAQGGGSNQRIFRKTWEWIADNFDKVNETLFVIQWTYPLRSEFYYKDVSSTKDKSENSHRGWWPVHAKGIIETLTDEDFKKYHKIINIKAGDDRQVGLMKDGDDIWYYENGKAREINEFKVPSLLSFISNSSVRLKNTDTLTDLKYHLLGFIPSVEEVCKIMLRYVVSLQSFFKLNNIKYIFFEGDRTNIEYFMVIENIIENNKIIDRDYFLEEDFVGFSGDNLTLNNHPNEQMQIVWAEKLIEFAREKEWF